MEPGTAKRGDSRNVFERFFADIAEDMASFGREIKGCCGVARGSDALPANLAPARAKKHAGRGHATPEDALPSASEHEDLDLAFVRALEKQALRTQAGERENENPSPNSAKPEGQAVSGRKERMQRAAPPPIQTTALRRVDPTVDFDPAGWGYADKSSEHGHDSVGSESASSVSLASLSPAHQRLRELSSSVRKGDEEARLLQAINLAEDAGNDQALAVAYEDAALHYANAQGRPWKALDFLREAWRLYAQATADGLAGAQAAEADFLEEATCCMVKARRLDEAVCMAERRCELLRDVDAAASNEAQIWANELKKRRVRNGHVKQLLSSIDVERAVESHEHNPLLRSAPGSFR